MRILAVNVVGSLVGWEATLHWLGLYRLKRVPLAVRSRGLSVELNNIMHNGLGRRSINTFPTALLSATASPIVKFSSAPTVLASHPLLGVPDLRLHQFFALHCPLVLSQPPTALFDTPPTLARGGRGYRAPPRSHAGYECRRHCGLLGSHVVPAGA